MDDSMSEPVGGGSGMNRLCRQKGFLAGLFIAAVSLLHVFMFIASEYKHEKFLKEQMRFFLTSMIITIMAVLFGFAHFALDACGYKTDRQRRINTVILFVSIYLFYFGIMWWVVVIFAHTSRLAMILCWIAFGLVPFCVVPVCGPIWRRIYNGKSNLGPMAESPSPIEHLEEGVCRVLVENLDQDAGCYNMMEYSKVTEDCPIGDDSGRISSSEAYKIASEYTPKSHHFIQLMKNSHLTSLYIPAHFAKFLPSKNHVKFEICDKDKTWPIKTCYKKGDRSHSFSGGWSEFVCENHIMVGDVLIIELDGVSELKVLLLKVLILRVKDPGPAHVDRFLPLTKPPRSTGSSDAQNKKRKALATEGFEVWPPPRTRSTGPVATDSPDDIVLVHCHGFGLKRPEKDCLKCSRCSKKFCIDYLVKKFQYVRANININSREWLCPSCKGDCDCKDCKDKLIVDDFLDEPSPPPPSHALYEVVERLLGRLKEYRQVFEDGLADINDRETTTPNWKEEQRLIKEKNTHLQEQCNETSKSIRQMVDLFPEDESIGFEYAELSRRDSEQEEQEEQEVQEEEEDEATLVEDSDHPIISLFTSTLQKLSGICKCLGAHCDILQAEHKRKLRFLMKRISNFKQTSLRKKRFVESWSTS